MNRVTVARSIRSSLGSQRRSACPCVAIAERLGRFVQRQRHVRRPQHLADRYGYPRLGGGVPVTLQHVSLEVRPGDVDAELAFWALLAFTPVEPPGSLGERSAWVQRGATQIHLLLDDEPV